MKRPSQKQQQIYEYIVSFAEAHGYPPSVREIGEYVGLKSPSTVHFHLKGLEASGLITKAEGKTRAITISGGPAYHRRTPVSEAGERCSNRIPLLGNVAAGTPILAEECVEDYLVFETNDPASEHFALRVRGESMLNAGILPEDIVVVHQQRDAHNGEIIVALFENEATVKTLRRRDGHTWLMPQNADYEPIDGDKAEIIGRVVAVIRRY